MCHSRPTFWPVQLPLNKDAAFAPFALLRGSGSAFLCVPGDGWGWSRWPGGVAGIAQAAIVFSRSVMQQTRDYTLRKDVHILGGTTKLGLLPQLKNLYADADEKFKKMEHFAAETEARLVK